MMPQYSSAKDIPDNLKNPAASIAWGHVRGLFVQELGDEKEGWVFWPCVHFQDDTWHPLAKDGDITKARQICARLSAIHDKPVVDWTRPAPPGLTFDSTQELIAGYLKGTKEWLESTLPEPAPLWGAGWEYTDHLFLDGLSHFEFDEEMRAMRKTSLEVFGSMEPSKLRAGLAIVKDQATRRWSLLHAANIKPDPKQEEMA